MKDKVEASIRRYIDSNHELGDRAGGSGHMAYVSYNLDGFNFKQREDGNIEVSFKYTLVTETEFTSYPDNPPFEDELESRVFLDKNFKVINPY